MSDNNKKDDDEFYDQLLEKTVQAYHKSPVYKNYGKEKNWYYAICDSPIQKQKPVFFGLNWGGKNHKPQKKNPTGNYERDFAVAKGAEDYLNKYLNQNLNDFNYSNLCFFRTPGTKYLTKKDFKLSLPLFKEYVEYINPPFCIMTGSASNIPYQHITNRNKILYDTPKKGKLTSGLLFEKFPFVSLPHNRAIVTTKARNYLWSKVNQELKRLNKLI